jgi:PhnB protein
MVNPIPDGYHVITPYLCVDGAADAIEFYKDVFGAVETVRMPQPDGRVGHAELQFGDSVVMLSDEFPEMGVVGPKTLGGTPMTLHLYVEDSDRTFERAVTAGSTVVQPVEDRFYGDRSGQLVDPWGHKWNVATHVEDVDPEEMQRRAAEEMSG